MFFTRVVDYFHSNDFHLKRKIFKKNKDEEAVVFVIVVVDVVVVMCTNVY